MHPGTHLILASDTWASCTRASSEQISLLALWLYSFWALSEGFSQELPAFFCLAASSQINALKSNFPRLQSQSGKMARTFHLLFGLYV